LEIPNKETLAAIKEVEEMKEMKKHPERYKTYTDADELFKDIT